MQANLAFQTLPTLNELTPEALEQGPLGEQRRAALATARQLELPVWRRTDLKDFSFQNLRAVFGSVTVETTADVAAQGVYVADFQTAANEKADLLAQYLGTAVANDHNTFVAYNAALAQDGLVVYVPRNVELAEPIRVTYTLPAGGQAIFPRTLIVTEANSRVTVVEEFRSADLQSYGAVVPVAELFANDGSEIRFISLQTLGQNAYQLGAQRAIVGRDARIWWLAGAVGANVQHIDMEVALQGNGAGLEWYGFTFGTGSQQLLWAPTVKHIGLSTEGQIDFRSAVADTAYVVFDGMIDIEKGAQGTNSDLRDAALHLSDKARSDSIPGLEIDANEVKAGHGSTSGQIDEEQLFYLMARGLSREVATQMIVLGFFSAIVERIPLDDVQERVLEMIQAKM
ncbi:MAG: Fe-S cluster assembly protein SufD [Chloroflexota bacterium]|nr:Fe-S cluster assembly protein SufD [Chloroflexota bacterium]